MGREREEEIFREGGVEGKRVGRDVVEREKE